MPRPRHLREAVVTVPPEYFAAVFEGADDALAIFALDGTVLAFNAAAERLFGYTKAEAIGHARGEGPEAAARTDFFRAVDLLRKGERPPAQELRRTRKDGREIWIDVTFAPLTSHEGELVGVFTAARDVSERHAMREDLKRSEASQALLAAIVESSHDAIFSHDAEGTLTTWNRGAERLYGYEASEILGQPWLQLLPPEVREAAMGRSPRVTPERPLVDFENTSLHKSGRRFPVSVTVSPLRDKNGERSGSSVIARDLTERRAAEELARALRQKEEQLRAAQKLEAIGALAGGVAHDFNNLLSVILSWASLGLGRLAAADPLHAELREIQTAAERAAALTRQLLAFGRRQVLQPTVLDLAEVLRELQPMIGRLVGEGVELVIIAPDDLPPVLADRGQLGQVVVNLAVNARDAMPTGGKLTIELSARVLDAEFAATHFGVGAGEHLCLAVSDTGHGMDDETRARVFEPFFTTKGEHGTGLGLATVFGIVKQSGGSIFVESATERGSTFEIYLPRTHEALRSRVVGREPVARAGHETVLLVEDETQVRAVVRRLLEGAGYRVLEAHGPGDALILSEQHAERIDLLLTDVVMPRLSGKQLAARLVDARPDLRVLFMSGYAADALSHHGVLESEVDFLEKPIRPESLLGTVRSVLDTPSRATLSP